MQALHFYRTYWKFENVCARSIFVETITNVYLYMYKGSPIYTVAQLPVQNGSPPWWACEREKS